MHTRHCSKTTSWEMNEHLYLSMLSKLRFVVQFAQIISISYDKVIAMDNTSWIGIHVYGMEGWEKDATFPPSIPCF